MFKILGSIKYCHTKCNEEVLVTCPQYGPSTTQLKRLGLINYGQNDATFERL